MISKDDVDAAIARVLDSDTPNFVELATIAGLDPENDFRYADLSEINFSGSNLSGFDFRGSSFEGATFVNARIAGAKFSRSRHLDSLLICAIDAEHALEPGRRRRRGRRGGRRVNREVFDVSQVGVESAQNESFKVLFSPAPTIRNEVDENTPLFAALEDAIDWLDKKPKDERSVTAIYSLIRLGCGRQETYYRAHHWLEANCESREALELIRILLPLDGGSNVSPLTVEYAIRCFRAHLASPEAIDILHPLLRLSASAEIMEDVFIWLESNSHHFGRVSQGLTYLVQTHGRDKRVKERAIQWIGEHFLSSAAGNLLLSVFKSDPDDEIVFSRCLDWLDQNSTNRTAEGLLTNLLLHRSRSIDELKERIFHWLDANWEWPHAVAVVRHLARHSDDREDIRKYLNKWIYSHEPDKNLQKLLHSI